MKHIQYSKLLYELHDKTMERTCGGPAPLRGATLTLHPENYAEFVRDLDIYKTMDVSTQPHTYMGIYLVESAAIPCDVAIVTSNDRVRAVLNLTDGTFTIGDLYDEGKVRSLRRSQWA